MNHSPYSKFDLEQLNYRDFLAMDRTTLANERTLLAYGRTSLMVLATGVTLLKVFAGSMPALVTGYLLILLGVILFAFGAFRYWKIRRAIRSAVDRAERASGAKPGGAPPGP